jgi:histidine triad (HIT) family protein
MTKKDCLFCKIIQGEIPCKKAFENEQVFAFHDIHPIAPVHVLFVHKEHTHDINDLVENSPEQLAPVYLAIREFSKSLGLDKKGFRVIANLGKEGGQTIFHTHFHFLGGRALDFTC